MSQSNEDRTYIAIDLKSFYASVECVVRGLDPMTTNLVVADETRTEKTICLAVSPSLKAYGIPGRARLFEVVQAVEQINQQRQQACHSFLMGESWDTAELAADDTLALGYLVAPPRMARYMAISAKIYAIYLRFISPEDIHVYSVDEVFIDATSYLRLYHTTADVLTKQLIGAILQETGIVATAGIGTNLYLAKIAMDIVAKHLPADETRARIATLDELSYRQQLWSHRPLTDFWRVGKGYAKKLASQHIYTMGDIAACSIHHEDLLYRMFGVNAELLIDHAWGWESCTIADIKAYQPESSSLSSGQVLQSPYPFDKARLIVREMTDLLVLELVEKGLVTDQMVLTVGYDTEGVPADYGGKLTTDAYGRRVPKSAHGSIRLDGYTASTRQIVEKVTALFEQIVEKALLVRRLNVVANHVIPEQAVPEKLYYKQLDLFTDYQAQATQEQLQQAQETREREMQRAMVVIKRKHGKNAIFKGMDLEDGATTLQRNAQVGGHRA